MRCQDPKKSRTGNRKFSSGEGRVASKADSPATTSEQAPTNCTNWDWNFLWFFFKNTETQEQNDHPSYILMHAQTCCNVKNDVISDLRLQKPSSQLHSQIWFYELLAPLYTQSIFFKMHNSESSCTRTQ
jgi:hypothetical protein|uniref:Uncharacterized protein n=1 Tax=Eutreptiella gymnastica TaxID=73025 RepID=A0A7S4LJE7_9EUGL|mmetsp:Transcript_46316/g.77790  ORF Transcript_46316/g.77790 Transcript_46316/m.77790 type:complete len:129 (+) Transcript_46316:277-663(+)